MAELNIPGAQKEKAPETQTEEKTVLDVLFPEKEVPLPDGQSLTVRPLTLKDLPRVSDAFGRLMSLAERGCTPAEIASRAFGELTSIVPYCIDWPVDKLPASMAPDILEAVVELNITEDVVRKWMTLVEKLNDAVPAELVQGKDNLLGKKSSQSQ